MEGYSMLLGRKNEYCENDYPAKSNLQIQCDPYQITNGIFHRTRKKILICMELQKLQRAKSILRKTKLQESGSLTSDHTTKLQ